MKAYFVTTGTIFGLFTVVHLLRVLERWHLLATDPWFVMGPAGIALVAGTLCLWAWRLLWISR